MSEIFDNGYWNNRDLSIWDPMVGEPGAYTPKYGWDLDAYFPTGSRYMQIVGSEDLYPYTSVEALVSHYGETVIDRWQGAPCFPIVTVRTKNVYGTCPGETTHVVYFILPDDLANNNFGLYIKYPKSLGGRNAYAYKGGSKLAPVWTGTSNVIAKVGNIPVNGIYKQTLYRPLNYEGGMGGSGYGGTNWDTWYSYPVQWGEPSVNSALSPWHGSSRETVDGKYFAQVQIVLGADEAFSGAAPFGYAIGLIAPIYGFSPKVELTDGVIGPTKDGNIDVTIKGRSGDQNNFSNFVLKVGEYWSHTQEFMMGTQYHIKVPYTEQLISAASQFEKNTGNKVQLNLISSIAMRPSNIDPDTSYWIPYAQPDSRDNSNFIFYNSEVTQSTGDIVISGNIQGLGYIDDKKIITMYSLGDGADTIRYLSAKTNIADMTFSADPNGRPVMTGIKVGKVDFRNHHHEMMLCGDKKDMYRVEVEGTADYGGGMCNIYMGGVRVGTCTLPGAIEFSGFAVVPFSEGVNGDISAQAYDMKGFVSEGQLAATAIYLVDDIKSAINTDKPTIEVATQRPYLYKYPSATITNIWRSNSSGVEDLENGTYAYIQGSYTGFTKNGLTINVKLTSQNGTLFNENKSADGSFTNTYGTYDTDHNWSFTLTVTDAFGGTIAKSKSIYSAECFMDFRAGGRALGIGMAALGDERVDIKWPIYAHAGIISSSTDTILSAQEISYLESADSITLKEKLDQMDATDTKLTGDMSTLQTFVNANVGASFQHVGSSAVNDFILISLGANSDQKLAIATIKDREITRPTAASNNVYRQVLTAPWDSKGYKTVYPIYAEAHIHAYTNGYSGVGANDYELDGQTAYGTYARSGIGFTGGNYYVGYESQWPYKNNSSSATTCYVSGMLMAIVQPK